MHCVNCNTISSAIAKTMLQGGVVMAKSGRLELGDSILQTTTVT